MPPKRPDVLFPISVLGTSRALALADATVWGATTAILTAWWSSGCAALPDDDGAALAPLARCSAYQWRRVRHQVRDALDELLPSLAMDYAKGRRAASRRRAAASHAAQVRHGRKVRPALPQVADMPILADAAPRLDIPWSLRLMEASRVQRQAAICEVKVTGSPGRGGRLIDTGRR